jgi:hypothetical protein
LEAIDHHHQALSLFRELGDRWGQAKTCRILVMLSSGSVATSRHVRPGRRPLSSARRCRSPSPETSVPGSPSCQHPSREPEGRHPTVALTHLLQVLVSVSLRSDGSL